MSAWATASLDILGFNAVRAAGLLGSARRGFALRRLVGGVNFVQYLEFQLALERLALRGGERVLDVASPKLLAAYLAARQRVAEIHMTDLADPRLDDFRALVPDAGQSRVHTRLVDATRLDEAYGEGSFDRVYCLTSLQHFGGEGDVAAMRQFARVLTPGGRLVVSVPYGPTWGEEPYPELGGTRKRYDEAALARRLDAPGLTRVDQVYYGDRLLPIDALASRYPRPVALLNWASPVIQPLFWVPVPPAEARGVMLTFVRG